jgi:hypothetical protein
MDTDAVTIGERAGPHTDSVLPHIGDREILLTATGIIWGTEDYVHWGHAYHVFARQEFGGSPIEAPG